MIYIPINELPTGFRPYPFKRFKLKALTINQALKLGSRPTDREIRDLMGELTDEIDTSLLVPKDLRFLIAVLAFNTEKDRSWRVDVTCPYCNDKRTMGLTRHDFPPVTVLEKDAPYPLTIADETHTYTLGFATVESMEKFTERDPKGENLIASIAQYVTKIDEETDPDKIYEILGSITDFALIALMLKTVSKYFAITDTYKQVECPKCKKTYRVPLSALEVTQYVPFLDTEALGQYKTNFRL
ncbi:MAG: hypothetical protein HUK12_01030 [Muribaculaceae bacterium]|nr:hypothetical protein [Muribaculaceae bacterium]